MHCTRAALNPPKSGRLRKYAVGKKEMHNSIQMSSLLEWKRSNFAF